MKSNISSDMNKPCWKLAKACPQSQKLFCFRENNLLVIGIIDLRSLGYYKMKQGILQQNLSRYYKFEKAEKLCEYFNRFVNALKKEREQGITRRQVPMVRPRG